MYVQDDLALPVALSSALTVTYLPEVVINPILNGIGAVMDPGLGLTIPCNLNTSNASLSFGFGGVGGPMFDVSFTEFVIPITRNNGSIPEIVPGSGSQLKSQDGEDVCNFGIQPSGDGSIILGDTFLRSVYAVFDLTNNQIGLAQTIFNSTESNVIAISGSELPSATTTVSALSATETFAGVPKMTTLPNPSSDYQPTYTFASPSFDLVGATSSSKSTSSASTTSFTSSPSAGLGHSAKLGIGLGVSLGIIFLASVGYVSYRYFRRTRKGRLATEEPISAAAEKEGPNGEEYMRPGYDGLGPTSRMSELHGESVPNSPRELEGSPKDTRKELP